MNATEDHKDALATKLIDCLDDYIAAAMDCREDRESDDAHRCWSSISDKLHALLRQLM